MKQPKIAKSPIAVITGGGDAPGLNAAIRATVVRTITHYQGKIIGISNGFNGFFSNEPQFHELSLATVHNLQFLGGTLLGAASQGSPFKNPQSSKKVMAQFKKNWAKLRPRGLIVMGGDGTQAMAREISSQLQIPIVGIPKTIDNDLLGCEQTLGFSTAVEVASQAAKSIQCTAHAHRRLMILEVMGRTSGFLALQAAIASGVSGVLIPEHPFDLESLVKKIRGLMASQAAYGVHSRGVVLMVAEGAKPKGNQYFQKKTPSGEMVLGGIGEWLAQALAVHLGGARSFEMRVTVLGHLQRGAEPNASDRILGAQLGVEAVDCLFAEKSGFILCPSATGMTRFSYEKLPDKRRTLQEGDPLLSVARRLEVLWS